MGDADHGIEERTEHIDRRGQRALKAVANGNRRFIHLVFQHEQLRLGRRIALRRLVGERRVLLPGVRSGVHGGRHETRCRGQTLQSVSFPNLRHAEVVQDEVQVASRFGCLLHPADERYECASRIGFPCLSEFLRAHAGGIRPCGEIFTVVSDILIDLAHNGGDGGTPHLRLNPHARKRGGKAENLRFGHADLGSRTRDSHREVRDSRLRGGGIIT